MRVELTKPQNHSSITGLDLFAISACWNLAVAQPLFEVLSRGVEFFVFRRVSAIELVLLVLVVSIIIPFLLIAVLHALGKVSLALRNFLFVTILTVLLTLIVLPLYRDSQLNPLFIVGCITVCAIGVTAGYLRFKNFRSFFLFLTPAVLLIPGLFFFQPQVRKMLQFNEPVLPHFKTSSKVPIVFVVFDEFPLVSLLNKEGFLDEKSYPNFAKLLSQADWYRHATTSASTTHASVPAILTGSTPDHKRLPIVRDYPRNLFTLLSESYDIQAIEAISLLPQKTATDASSENFLEHFRSVLQDLGIIYLNIVLPADWRVSLPAVTGNWGNFAQQTAIAKDSGLDRTRPEIFQLFLDSIIPSEKPGLFFLHSQLPHSPWQFLPSGKEYSAVALDGMFVRYERWTKEDSASLCAQQRHMLQVAYTDHLIGRLISKLTEIGLFDQSLIIITADHGASFRPGDARRIITETNYADIIFVPMIIKKPGQKTGRILDWMVQTTDIVPTIAEILGFQMPWNVTGVSVLHDPPKNRTQVTVLNHKGKSLQFNSVENAKIQSVNFRIHRLGEGHPFALPPTDFSQRWLNSSSKEIRSDLSGKKASLYNPQGFMNVDLASNYLPVFVTGSIYFPDGKLQQLNLGIGVNGTIRAVTNSFRLNNSSHAFGALIPEDSLVNGKNDIQIILLSESNVSQIPLRN